MKNNIKSIVKAGAVINLLAASETPLSLATIAAETGIVKSTVHGIVSTLVDIGYVTQIQECGRYQLGMRLFEIGSSISNKWNERKIAYPYMQKIAEKTDETVHMAILSEGEVLYVNKQESNRSIQIVTADGVRLPAHCTGLGKVLLSGMSNYEVKQFCNKMGLAKYTETTITSYEALIEELNNIREKGYAVDRQEFMEGLFCIAVPIFNNDEKIIAALSLSGPVSRMSDASFNYKKRCMLKSSVEISSQLGYMHGIRRKET